MFERAALDLSLREWQARVGVDAVPKNGRSWTESDYAVYVNGAWAKICETLRKRDTHKTIELLPVLAERLFIFANKVGENLDDAVWFKYPGVCPSCLVSEDCHCIKGKKNVQPREILDGFRAREGRRPKSLDEVQEMLSRLYGKSNQVLWPEQVWLHFEEELGEVGEAFLFEGPEQLRMELGDAFAWLLAFCNRLNVNLSRLSQAKFFPESSYSLLAIGR